MPIADKVAAAKRIDQFIREVVLGHGGFSLKYRITVNPPRRDDDLEQPDILVEFAGADSALLLADGGEVLRSIEFIVLKMLRLENEEHDKVMFDCKGYRATRTAELRAAAMHAAERVRETNQPYQFSPMSPRERRIVHLALKNAGDVRTESNGEAQARAVVVYPKDYQGSAPAAAPRGFSRGRRR